MRPLTYRDQDTLEIITPNSFLKLHTNSNLILRDNKENEIWVEDHDRDTLVKTLEVQEENFEFFKREWYESYLLSLRESSKNLYQTDWTNRVTAGSVVLVKLPNKPRPFWVLGLVKEVVISPDDNKVRTVKLKLGNGTGS